MLFGSKKLLGLDIGLSSIKLVEVEVNKNSATLTSFGFVPTPNGAIVGGEIDNPQALAEAVSHLVRQTNTRLKRACTAMWGAGVITKKISIPKIDEKLLPEQLKWEAEQYIPFDLKDINLQYQVLRNSHPMPEQMNVLLVAAKRDSVLRYAEVIEMAGLECNIIDVAGFALANCFEVNYPELRNSTVIILNFGSGVTNFVVIENGEATFSRDLNVGGNSYTSDIQRTMGITPEEAESMKISAGTGQAVPKEVTDCINQTNEVVAEEVRRGFDFFMATSTEAHVEKVFVTGGSAGVPGLYEQIQSTLNLPLEAFNPFARVQHANAFSSDYLAQITPYAGVGIGLALRQVTR
jgi:type IV pilus assembly protein PilM